MPLYKGCQVVPAHTGTRNCFRFDLVCPGYQKKLPYEPDLPGVIEACRYKRRGRVVYGVTRLYVGSGLRRRGLATKLYEAAARQACRERARLASIEREFGVHSTDFWKKQVAKGRAKRYSARYTKYAQQYGRARWSESQDTFILNDCSEPIDLSGVSTTPAWIR